FLSDEQRFSLKDFELHVADPKDIIERWGKSHPELISNTANIAARCDVEIQLGEILIPKFPTPTGETEKTLLEKLVWRGLAWRYGGQENKAAGQLSVAGAKKYLTAQVIERAEFELGIIDKMGF